MKNKLIRYFRTFFKTYEANLAKIVFIVFLHIITSFIVNLPYINIFASMVDSLPFIIDWVALVILFKPSPRIIFWLGVVALLCSFPFLLLRLTQPAEILGNICYLMFVTYILLTIKSLKNS